MWETKIPFSNNLSMFSRNTVNRRYEISKITMTGQFYYNMKSLRNTYKSAEKNEKHASKCYLKKQKTRAWKIFLAPQRKNASGR